MILLAGLPDEAPMEAVARALAQRGAPFLMLDQRQAALATLELHGAGGVVSGRLALPDGSVARVADITAIYARQTDASALPEARALGQAGITATQRLDAALLLLQDLAPCLVVNRPAAQASNRVKPHQARLIRAMGFSVPETLVTNDADAVRDFHARHRRVVFKSASAIRSIVRELDDAALARLPMLVHCPVQFQAMVEGLDVRVHVVGNNAFATRADSDVIDYRYGAGSTRLAPFTLPDDVAARCVALAAALNLPLCGIDLKHTPDGDWVCFEANPQPAFTWFDVADGAPIATAVAALLARTGATALSAPPPR
jgi:hypothetical protein